MADFNDPLVNKHINEAVRPIADRIVGLVMTTTVERAHYEDVVKPQLNALGATFPDNLVDGSNDGRSPLTRGYLNQFWNAWDELQVALDALDNYDDLARPRVNVLLP